MIEVQWTEPRVGHNSSCSCGCLGRIEKSGLLYRLEVGPYGKLVAIVVIDGEFSIVYPEHYGNSKLQMVANVESIPYQREIEMDLLEAVNG